MGKHLPMTLLASPAVQMISLLPLTFQEQPQYHPSIALGNPGGSRDKQQLDFNSLGPFVKVSDMESIAFRIVGKYTKEAFSTNEVSSAALRFWGDDMDLDRWELFTVHPNSTPYERSPQLEIRSQKLNHIQQKSIFTSPPVQLIKKTILRERYERPRIGSETASSGQAIHLKEATTRALSRAKIGLLRFHFYEGQLC